MPQSNQQDSKPSAHQAVPAATPKPSQEEYDQLIFHNCAGICSCEECRNYRDKYVSAPQAESVPRNCSTCGDEISYVEGRQRHLHGDSPCSARNPVGVAVGKDAARNERIAELSRKVWKDCGWGDGDTECSEGRLCDAAVRAGYEAGEAYAASETAALRAERDHYAEIAKFKETEALELYDRNERLESEIKELREGRQ